MTKKLQFERFYEILSKQPYLTPNLVGVFMERCITCCSLKSKKSGCSLKSYSDTQNIYNKPYSLIWETEFTEKLKKAHQDKNKMTEDAAVFLSLSLMLELTDYTNFLVSEGNNGIDYWMTNDSDELEFSARLEISGINEKKPSNNIKTRKKTKIKQTKQSDSTKLPAFISIIEFSQLEAIIFER